MFTKPVKVIRVQKEGHDHTHILLSDGSSFCLSNQWLGKPDEIEIPVSSQCQKEIEQAGWEVTYPFV